jgi:hypothetical protein
MKLNTINLINDNLLVIEHFPKSKKLISLVSGVSHGIDYHLTELFYRDKHGVIIVSRNKSNLQKVKERNICTLKRLLFKRILTNLI